MLNVFLVNITTYKCFYYSKQKKTLIKISKIIRDSEEALMVKKREWVGY